PTYYDIRVIFFFMLPPSPRSTLFPYTTLFRSVDFEGRRILRDQKQVPILQAALVGFDIHFDNGEHPVNRLEIQATGVGIVPDTRDTEAQATVRFLIRDASGNIDDPFSGVVEVLFIAEVA